MDFAIFNAGLQQLSFVQQTGDGINEAFPLKRGWNFFYVEVGGRLGFFSPEDPNTVTWAEWDQVPSSPWVGLRVEWDGNAVAVQGAMEVIAHDVDPERRWRGNGSGWEPWKKQAGEGAWK